ncbi:MAG TPA: DUF6077 domain-containing protein [Rhodanobacteraceae bacterium]
MRSVLKDAPDRIAPALVVLYAAWTMYVHLITVTHSSFVALLHWLPLVALLAVAATIGWFRLPEPLRQPVSAATGGRPAAGPVAASATHESSTYAVPLVVLAVAMLWVGLLLVGMPYAVFWWGALLALCWAWITDLRGGPHPAPVDIARLHVPWKQALWIVFFTAAAAVCVTLVANRPDPDDALHLSIPATLLRFPHQPVLLHDTLYRLPDAPILTPFYRLNSYDVLIGLLARVTGIDLHVIAYLVLPSLLAVFSILAWVYLLRRIVPERWPSVLLILFLVVLALGEAHRAYGNFAFVRLFQGKAILATCMVPVIAGSALSFARNGGVRRWLLLFAAQVAAVGFAATSLFVAPAAAALGLAGGWSASATGSRRFALGVLASAYVFAAAWAVSSATHGGEGFVSTNPVTVMPQMLYDTWGPWSTGALLVALLTAWAFVRDPMRARYFSAGTFFFLLAILNPYTCRFVADHFVGVYTYWRLTWALPLPFFLAVVLDGVAVRALHVKPKALAACACAILAGLALAFGWRFGTLRAGNSVTLGIPGLKVYPVEYRVARQVTEKIPEEGVVLAPEWVAFWLPTFVVHPQLLGARIPYLTQGFAPAEAEKRRALMQYVAGTDRTAGSAALLAGALQSYRLTAVVFKPSAPWHGEIESVLASHAWQPLSCGSYDTWVRGGSHASTTKRIACEPRPE